MLIRITERIPGGHLVQPLTQRRALSLNCTAQGLVLATQNYCTTVGFSTSLSLPIRLKRHVDQVFGNLFGGCVKSMIGMVLHLVEDTKVLPYSLPLTVWSTAFRHSLSPSPWSTFGKRVSINIEQRKSVYKLLYFCLHIPLLLLQSSWFAI